MSVIRNPNIVTRGLIFRVDASGLKSYNHPDTVWNDVAGGHDLTLGNAPEYEGNSFRFNPNPYNQYAKTTDVLVTAPTELTISSWFKKRNNASTYEAVMHCAANASVGPSEYWMGCETVTDNIVATIGATYVGSWAAGLTTVPATVGVWFNVVAAWDGSVVRVYINGEFIKQYALTGYTNTGGPTRLAASSDGAQYQFGGNIGEAMINDVCLTEDEIRHNYNVMKGRFI